MRRRPVRIIVCDDHGIVRRGVRGLLRRRMEVDIVGEATTFDEVISLAEALRPDVTVLDLKMPGPDVMEVIERLAASTAIVVYTATSDPSLARESIRAGASGYVLKTSEPRRLLEAVRAVRRGLTYLDESIDPRPGAGAWRPLPLSQRELDVLRAVARGFSSREVATQLGVGVKTIETYRSRVREKLGLKSHADLVEAAIKMGLLDPE